MFGAGAPCDGTGRPDDGEDGMRKTSGGRIAAMVADRPVTLDELAGDSELRDLVAVRLLKERCARGVASPRHCGFETRRTSQPAL